MLWNEPERDHEPAEDDDRDEVVRRQDDEPDGRQPEHCRGPRERRCHWAPANLANQAVVRRADPTYDIGLAYVCFRSAGVSGTIVVDAGDWTSLG